MVSYYEHNIHRGGGGGGGVLGPCLGIGVLLGV